MKKPIKIKFTEDRIRPFMVETFGPNNKMLNSSQRFKSRDGAYKNIYSNAGVFGRGPDFVNRLIDDQTMKPKLPKPKPMKKK
jgi:hypothetical protein